MKDRSAHPARLSVCMAVYNGADYLREQLDSILADLGPADEVVLVDDCSRDESMSVVAAYQDQRIKVHQNLDNVGHVATFERALSLASGEYIFLADQDDVWPSGRTEAMLQRLETYEVVFGNLSLFGSPSAAHVATLRPEDSGRPVRNVMGILLGRRSYFGAACGLRSEALDYLLPFPSYTESHDHWIAFGGALLGGLGHVEPVVLNRRIHETNLTARRRRSLPAAAATRALMVRSILELLRRRRSWVGTKSST